MTPVSQRTSRAGIAALLRRPVQFPGLAAELSAPEAFYCQLSLPQASFASGAPSVVSIGSPSAAIPTVTIEKRTHAPGSLNRKALGALGLSRAAVRGTMRALHNHLANQATSAIERLRTPH